MTTRTQSSRSVRRAIYTETHEQFRNAVRAFLDGEVRPSVDSYIEQHAFPRELWLAAGEQGLLGLEIPEAYGGADASDYRFNAVLMEELAKVNLALASSISIHYDVVVPYLVRLTTDAQRARWLPRAAKGELVAAIGMTEPSAGSDLAALRTRAERTEGGWILNGSKTFITNGYSADLVLTAARTTPGSRSRGITLFAVEAGMAGFTRGRKLEKVGQPEADTAELFFDNVLVPDANVVGDVDRGFLHMMEHLSQERIGAAVANLAHARQILDETIMYCRERTAFGQPIGAFQHNKFLLADLTTRADVTQAYVDQCIEAHADGRLQPVDAAKAKWWTAEVQNHILDHCVQLHGGYGYMNEYRVARAWRDARVTKIWAGSNEIMKEIIGRDLGF
jgi:alkylation response protein AidB-like acyl-CoA dehydrogenase